MQIFSIFVFIVLYLYFYTPYYLINIMFTIIYPTKLTYIFNYSKYDNVSRVITYKFDHGFYDGSLMSQYIQKSNSKHKRLIKTPKSLYDDFQIIEYIIPNNVKLYSSFTYAISSILRNMQTYYKNNYPKQYIINVGIIINKRHLLKEKSTFGNYIRAVYYNINVYNSYDEICIIHDNAVKKEQNNKMNLHYTCYDLYMRKTSNIVFNSHRALSYIKRDDNNTLTLIRNKNFKNKEDMESKMFTRNNTKDVYLSYLDKKWVIGAIK